jgi:hypothetical protein
MRPARPLLLACSFAALLCAQQFKFNLDHLAEKASNAVDVSVNSATLQLAAKFLDSKDPEEAAVKKMINGLEGIYVRHFEFKTAGTWTQADLDGIRNQLKGSEWSRLLGYKSEDGDNAEVYLRTESNKVNGVAILAFGPKQFTAVNIVGPVDLDALAGLGGEFGIPKLTPPPRKK